MPVRFEVHVQPRAAKTAVAGLHDGRIKIRLAAPPVDGAANAELIDFLASQLDLAKSKIRIVAGLKGRRKTIEVDEISLAVIHERLR
jgi:uncharacterized protein